MRGTVPPYPAILTNANWQKEKGVIAKLSAKETGIGAALDKAKAKYDNIKWAKLNCDDLTNAQSGVNSPEDVEAKYQEAKKYYTEAVEPARAELSAVGTLAAKVAEEFKKSSVIPKSSREHVEKIGAAAGTLMTALKDNSPFYVAEKQAFDDKKKMMAEMIKGVTEIAQKNLAKIKTDIGALLQKKEASEKLTAFTTLREGPMRGLAAALDRHPTKALGTWNRDHFNKYTVNSFDPKSDKDLPDMIKQVLEALKELEGKLK